MTKLQEIIETLKEKPDVVYVGEWFDKMPGYNGFEPGIISGANHLYIAPKRGLYNVDELNQFMDGLLPQVQLMRRKPFVKDTQLRTHGSNPKGIRLGYLDYADVIGKRSLREERVFERSVPLDYTTAQALEKGKDIQRHPQNCEQNRTIKDIRSTESNTPQIIIYSAEEPLIRIVRIEPYPDERIARDAKEGELYIGRGACLRDSYRIRDDRAFISNWQLRKYQASNMARKMLVEK